MTDFWVCLPDRPPILLDQERPQVALGRSSTNDLVIDDASLSRHHARLSWTEEGILLEDLGSRNGTLVNGERIQGPHLLCSGDEVTVGKRGFRLESAGGQVPMPAILDTSAFISVPVAQLRNPLAPDPAGADARHWGDAMGIIHGVSLELLGEVSVDLMLSGLLDRLYGFLDARRGAILLRDSAGRMTQVAARSGSRGRAFQVQLSRTMLEAAFERREALLIVDPERDERLGQAPSIVRSGIRSIMTVPLEHAGEVVGLVYFDAGVTRAPFSEEDLRLVAVLGHLAAAKIRATRLAEEVRAKRDLDKEMAVARQIQERILPDNLPDLEPFEMFGVNVPCRRVSGDLYGFWPRPDGKAWLAIADVSGKGIGPGLLMATFQAYMQAWSELALGPAELAGKLSLALSRRTTPNRFITAFLALLDPEEGTVTATNAGHNPILLLRADGTEEQFPSQGFPISMFPGREYGQCKCRMVPGDLLFLYTDGITEATDPEGNELNLATLAQVLRAQGNAPLPDLYAALAHALQAHTQGAPLADDQTVVLLRRKA
jgi:phosphoserine phosphatase RsbU/P